MRVPPFQLTTLAEMVPGIKRYQIIQDRKDHLEVRFTSMPAADSEVVFASLEHAFEDFLRQRALSPTVSVTVMESDAIQRDRGGKVRQVLSLENNSSDIEGCAEHSRGS